MTCTDGFVEVKPGFLVDPALRLRLHSGGSSGLALNDAYLVIAYDPEIRADRLLVPPSDAQRAWRRSSPVTAHYADDPVIFESEKYDPVVRIAFTWHDHETCTRHKIAEDEYNFKLNVRILANRGYPVISDDPKRTLLYGIISAVKLSSVRTDDFLSDRFPRVRRFEMCIRSDLATSFFQLRPVDYAEVEPGWLLLACRDVQR
jgi:hypothetical protein